MKPIRGGRKPESKIQDEIITLLTNKGWIVKATNGNIYQQGFPDLYAIHVQKKMQRWIEVKRPTGYSFTPAQREYYPILNSIVGVWIMSAATQYEYDKLFKAPNFLQYFMGIA